MRKPLADAQAYQYESVYLTLASNIALAAIQEASLRGQIAATRNSIDIQTQLLEILRRQNSAGQIALPDVVAQETAVAQARLLLRHWRRPSTKQRNLIAVLTGKIPKRKQSREFQARCLPAAAEITAQPARRPGPPASDVRMAEGQFSMPPTP